MNIVIFGSRGITSYGAVKLGAFYALSDYGLSGEDIRKATLISGGAKGVDRLGEQFANEFGLEIKQFIPDWNKLGKKPEWSGIERWLTYLISQSAFGMEKVLVRVK